MIIYEGEIVPAWYGVAYYRWWQRAAVCYPVPFHLLVRWARDCYYVVKCSHRPDWFAAQQLKAHLEGVEEGKAQKQRQIQADLKNEYDLGYARGRAEGQRQATEQII